LLKELLEKRQLFPDFEFTYYAFDKGFDKIDDERKGDRKTRREGIKELGGSEFLNNMIHFDFDQHLNCLRPKGNVLRDFIKDKGITHVVGFNSFHYMNKLGHSRLVKICKECSVSLLGVMTNSDILADMDYSTPFRDRLGQLKLKISYDHEIFEEFFLTKNDLDSVYKGPSAGFMTGTDFWLRVTSDRVISGRELMRMRVVYYTPFQERTIPMLQCKPVGMVNDVEIQSIASGMTTQQLSTFLNYPEKRSVPRPKKNGFLIRVIGRYGIQRDGKVWKLSIFNPKNTSFSGSLPYISGYMEVLYDRTFDRFLALPVQIHQVNLTRLKYLRPSEYLSWFAYDTATVVEYETFDRNRIYEGIIFETDILDGDRSEVFIKPYCVLDMQLNYGAPPLMFEDFEIIGLPIGAKLKHMANSVTMEFLVHEPSKRLFFVRFRNKPPNPLKVMRSSLLFYRDPSVKTLIEEYYKYPTLDEYYEYLRRDVFPTVKFPSVIMDDLFKDAL
jgi:hypothetical protein